jgi:hypothetical protein
MTQFFSGLKNKQNLRNGWRIETFLRGNTTKSELLAS